MAAEETSICIRTFTKHSLRPESPVHECVTGADYARTIGRSGPRASARGDPSAQARCEKPRWFLSSNDDTRPAAIQEPDTSAPTEQPATDDSQAILERWQRERAEFRNFKRRIEEERRGDRESAVGESVERILPLIDELDRALEQVPPELTDHPWVRGILVARRQLLEAVRDLGVERFGTEGEEFDPALHEAMSFEPRADIDQRRINEVHRPGYAIGRRLLRPAQVTVIGPEKDDRSGRSAAGEGRSV